MSDDEAPAMKRCEECGEEYEEGTGATEDARAAGVRLRERFCSESCADTYVQSLLDDDEDDDDLDDEDDDDE